MQIFVYIIFVLAAPHPANTVERRGMISPAATKPDDTAQMRISKTYGKIPLSFEVNKGQIDSQVKFLSRGAGYTIFLTSNEAILTLNKTEAIRKDNIRMHKTQERQITLLMKLISANPQAHVSGLEELHGKSNYFIGSNPKK